MFSNLKLIFPGFGQKYVDGENQTYTNKIGENVLVGCCMRPSDLVPPLVPLGM